MQTLLVRKSAKYFYSEFVFAPQTIQSGMEVVHVFADFHDFSMENQAAPHMLDTAENHRKLTGSQISAFSHGDNFHRCSVNIAHRSPNSKHFLWGPTAPF